MNRSEFTKFIFDQVFLVLTTLAESIANGEDRVGEIRTGFISSIIDRTFLRFHNDQENFLPHFDVSENQLVVNRKDAFIQFLMALNEACQDNFITRRLVGKILLGLGQNTANKIAKLIFLVDADSRTK